MEITLRKNCFIFFGKFVAKGARIQKCFEVTTHYIEQFIRTMKRSEQFFEIRRILFLLDTQYQVSKSTDVETNIMPIGTNN